MRYSIIIPCYNSMSTIGRTIDSLLCQPFSDYEIILVDDCSEDDTIKVIEQYNKKRFDRIALLKNDSNLGPGGSRNRALEIAKGDYIGFIDSDDFVSSDYFSKINSVIDSCKPDVIYYGSNNVLRYSKLPIREPKINSAKDCIALSNGAITRFVAQKILWENVRMPNIRNAEDLAVFPIILSNCSSFVHIDKPLYNYVVTKDSLSRIKRQDTVSNFLHAFQWALKRINLSTSDSCIEAYGINMILYGAVINALVLNKSRKDIFGIIQEFNQSFPQWSQNPYCKYLSHKKRIFLSFVNHQNYYCLVGYVYLYLLYFRFSRTKIKVEKA